MNSGYSHIIHQRILSLCQSDGMTIADLSRISGVSRKTINNILYGNSTNPKIITIHKIANAFCLTLAEFLDIPEINDYCFPDSFEDDVETDLFDPHERV